LRSYAAWTGLAFQMAAFVVAGLLLAKLINKSLQNEMPWINMAGALAGVIAALIFAIRFILKHQKDS
jgi:hypothetical protein